MEAKWVEAPDLIIEYGKERVHGPEKADKARVVCPSGPFGRAEGVNDARPPLTDALVMEDHLLVVPHKGIKKGVKVRGSYKQRQHSDDIGVLLEPGGPHILAKPSFENILSKRRRQTISTASLTIWPDILDSPEYLPQNIMGISQRWKPFAAVLKFISIWKA